MNEQEQEPARVRVFLEGPDGAHAAAARPDARHPGGRDAEHALAAAGERHAALRSRRPSRCRRLRRRLSPARCGAFAARAHAAARSRRRRPASVAFGASARAMTARPPLPASAAAVHGADSLRVREDARRARGRHGGRRRGRAAAPRCARADGVVEIKRVLQRPLVTRAVGADEFALELARTYNQAAPDAAATLAGDLARETDLARLMQDMPVTEDLLDSTTQAPVIRMINALLLQALRERASDLHFEPYEAALGGALPHRRRAARRDRAAARAARGARVAAQDHGEPRHRGEAPAAGRPHLAQARRPAGRRARVHAADRPRRARGAAPARQGSRAPRPDRARHGRAARARPSIA